MLRLLIMLVVALPLGCRKEYDPRILIKDYRVIGVVAEPPEVRGDGRITLTVADTAADPNPEEPVVYTWKVCAFSLGPLADFECFDPSIEFELPARTRTVELDLGAAGIDLIAQVSQWAAALGAMAATGPTEGRSCQGEDCEGAEGGPPKGPLELQITVVSGPESGKSVTTVKRVKVVLDDSELDTNPVIEGLSIGDGEEAFVAKAGDRVPLQLQVDASSFQAYVDPRGKMLQEEPLVTWYTTAGKLDPAITSGQDLETTLELPKVIETRPVRVFAALRDKRGGFAYAEGRIEVQ